MNTNLHHEKILYLYSQALEQGDFDAISAIFEQAADDTVLEKLLFELDSIYQAEFPVETVTIERLTMSESYFTPTESPNGYRAAIPARRNMTKSNTQKRHRILRTAAAILVLVSVAILYQVFAPSSEDVHVEVTPSFAQEPITAENIGQLHEIRRFGEDGYANGALWTPDGERVVVYGTLGIWIYDADNLAGEPILTIPTDAAIYDADLSPDGSLLATGHSDGTLRLYRVDDGTLEWSVQTHEGNGTRIVVFSPDGQTIASSGLQTVILWAVEDGRKVLVTGESFVSSSVGDIVFSANGERLAWSGVGFVRLSLSSEEYPSGIRRSITVMDIATRETMTFGVGDPWIIDFALTSDGRSVITVDASLEPELSVWDVENIHSVQLPEARSITLDDGLRAYGLFNFEDYAVDIELRSDSVLAVLHQSPEVGISEWNLNTLEVIDTISFIDPDSASETDDSLDSPHGMAFSQDGGRVLIESGGNIVLVDIASQQTIAINHGHSTGIASFAISESSLVLALSGSDGVSIRDIQTDTLLTESGTAPNFSGISNLTFFPDDETLVLTGRTFVTGTQLIQSDDTLFMWNIISNDVTSISAPQSTVMVMSIDVNADGSKVAYIPSSEVIRLYDVASGHTDSLTNNLSRSRRLLGNERVRFQPGDDTIIAYTMGDTFIHVITDEGNAIADLTENSNIIRDMAFSPDGRYLASVNDDGISLMWDTETWDEIATVEVGTAYSIAFNADGSLIAIGGEHDITFWGVETNSLVGTLQGHTSRVTKLVFTEDGSVLASLSYDGTVRLWAVD